MPGGSSSRDSSSLSQKNPIDEPQYKLLQQYIEVTETVDSYDEKRKALENKIKDKCDEIEKQAKREKNKIVVDSLQAVIGLEEFLQKKCGGEKGWKGTVYVRDVKDLELSDVRGKIVKLRELYEDQGVKFKG